MSLTRLGTHKLPKAVINIIISSISFFDSNNIGIKYRLITINICYSWSYLTFLIIYRNTFHCIITTQFSKYYYHNKYFFNRSKYYFMLLRQSYIILFHERFLNALYITNSNTASESS